MYSILKIQNWKMKFMEYTNLSCTSPCSMYSVLLDNKLIPDPFYGCNEEELTKLSRNDCEFYSEFNIADDDLSKNYVELSFYGLDTICEIFVNDIFLAQTKNMHRKYTFDIKNIAKKGKNTLKIVIKSPIQYFEKMNIRHFLRSNDDTIPGAAHLRKAQCMSGWDWAPKLPDMGIFRDVELSCYNVDKIESFTFSQKHKNNSVDLTFTINTEKNSNCEIYTHINGVKTKIENSRTIVTIDNPKLWWVRGYGEQNLYDLVITLEKDGVIIDKLEKKIGLRTLTVSTAPSSDGNEFCFVINGVKIFSMGANYVPQDSLYARITSESVKKRIDDFIFANYNTIRVWGGAYYPDDCFYDYCDEKGLIVWQDYMVACAHVWLTNENKNELIEEAKYNLKRFSPHACLGLLCGNNEMEPEMEFTKKALAKIDYLVFYEQILPEIAQEYAPDTFYWPSSPSSGGGFDYPNSYKTGDVHYWDVWGGDSSFESYREHKFRFCSEYGFESFPSMKTIDTFSEKSDQNMFSKVMENHQKCRTGNIKMLMYLSENYLYPTSFENLVYASQLMQAVAIRSAVEHFRQIRGYCMGSLYWQANDCWPVCSWSSVDYFGRYKALHYTAKKFYAPISEGIFIDNNNVVVNVANETLKSHTLTLKWSICKNDFSVIKKGEITTEVEKLSALDVLNITVTDINPYDTFFCADLYDGEKLVIRRSELFVKPKHFKWLNPNIKVDAKEIEDGIELLVCADNYAGMVEIDFKDFDLILSDNYFDITDKNKYIIKCKTKKPKEEILSSMIIKSTFDIK